MPDYYHTPALILTALLLPAFGYLYLRFRDTRTLLWFLGFLFAMLRMVLHYQLGPWIVTQSAHPWLNAAGTTFLQVSCALFLASLSPMRFRVGRWRILFVIPFSLPLVIYTVLLYGVYRGIAPAGPAFFVFPAFGFLSVVVGCFWGARNESTPAWFGGGLCGAAGILALFLCLTQGPGWALTSVESSSHIVAMLLVVFVFRRISPGVALSVLGFAAWSLSILEIFPSIGNNPAIDTNLVHVIVMGKVVAAMGMILLALEDQLAINKAVQERERRVRLEMEAYTNLVLSRRRVEDFDHQGTEICQTVVEYSRFSEAVLLLEESGRYCVAGAAGLDTATVTALQALATRIPAIGFLAPGTAPSAVEFSLTLSLDLGPLLEPGDDLKRLRFTKALAIPMTGRSGTEGALLLAGLRSSQNPRGKANADRLRADDLMPVEMLTARLQSVRSQTIMLEKLIDSEKFAGLGQLAASVTQQLNNPLTVILGYASLLDETPNLDALDRKGVEAILTEARRMRATLESLTRISRSQGDQLAAVSVSELLTDLEQLHRSDFLHRSIDFRLNIAPALPRALCHAQQMRQAILHCLQFAIDAVEKQRTATSLADPKTIRLEATTEGNHVQILVAHSGPGFLQPERAFDPFVPSQTAGETAGLGLSLCATILRDNNGRASAVNLDPSGAAIILELQAA